MTVGASRIPTEKQYGIMLSLGRGDAGLSRLKRDTRPLLRRGWVTAEFREPYYQFVRLTPDGFRALADAVERYGLPEMGPQPKTHRRVCSSCGSTRHRYEEIPVEEAIAA